MTSPGISTLAMYIGLPCITIFLAGFLVLALGDGVVHRITTMGWLRWVGGVSYGIYIFHVLLLPFYHRIPSIVAPHVGRNVALLIDSASGIILTPLIAWLSFRFFESPFLRSKIVLNPSARYNQSECNWRRMIIGVPKEVKDHESRVGITPAGVKALVEAGHKVLVEHDAGALSAMPDDEYQADGAEIVGSGLRRVAARRHGGQGQGSRSRRSIATSAKASSSSPICTSRRCRS